MVSRRVVQPDYRDHRELSHAYHQHRYSGERQHLRNHHTLRDPLSYDSYVPPTHRDGHIKLRSSHRNSPESFDYIHKRHSSRASHQCWGDEDKWDYSEQHHVHRVPPESHQMIESRSRSYLSVRESKSDVVKQLFADLKSVQSQVESLSTELKTARNDRKTRVKSSTPVNQLSVSPQPIESMTASSTLVHQSSATYSFDIAIIYSGDVVIGESMYTWLVQSLIRIPISLHDLFVPPSSHKFQIVSSHPCVSLVSLGKTVMSFILSHLTFSVFVTSPEHRCHASVALHTPPAPLVHSQHAYSLHYIDFSMLFQLSDDIHFHPHVCYEGGILVLEVSSECPHWGVMRKLPSGCSGPPNNVRRVGTSTSVFDFLSAVGISIWMMDLNLLRKPVLALFHDDLLDIYDDSPLFSGHQRYLLWWKGRPDALHVTSFDYLSAESYRTSDRHQHMRHVIFDLLELSLPLSGNTARDRDGHIGSLWFHWSRPPDPDRVHVYQFCTCWFHCSRPPDLVRDWRLFVHWPLHGRPPDDGRYFYFSPGIAVYG